MIHEGQLTLAKSLRRCRISKLPLTAHKVLQTPNRCRLFRWYWLFTFIVHHFQNNCIIHAVYSYLRNDVLVAKFFLMLQKSFKTGCIICLPLFIYKKGYRMFRYGIPMFDGSVVIFRSWASVFGCWRGCWGRLR